MPPARTDGDSNDSDPTQFYAREMHNNQNLAASATAIADCKHLILHGPMHHFTYHLGSYVGALADLAVLRVRDSARAGGRDVQQLVRRMPRATRVAASTAR